MPLKISRLLKNITVANSGMVRNQLACMLCFFVVFFSTMIVAKTLMSDGSNSRIVVGNAVFKGEEG